MDMGDGRILAAEDVLEGHSARLLANRHRFVPRTLSVQVQDDLSAAITVMAPELAPLADIAEKVAVAVPAVEPAPAFRRNLYEALERTHRQIRNQESLGTRSCADTGYRAAYGWLALSVALCVLSLVGWMFYRRR